MHDSPLKIILEKCLKIKIDERITSDQLAYEIGQL